MRVSLDDFLQERQFMQRQNRKFMTVGLLALSFFLLFFLAVEHDQDTHNPYLHIAAKNPAPTPLPQNHHPVLFSAELSLLSYNVHGIPEVMHPLTESSFSQNTTERVVQIANRLGQKHIDLVLLQEVWTKDIFHLFVEKIPFAHAFFFYQRAPSLFKLAGSGLAAFTLLPVKENKQLHFSACHGRVGDCTTSKGVQLLRLVVGEKKQQGVTEPLFLDVYHLHLDADTAPPDVKVRRQQINEVIAFIRKHSAQNNFLLVGDFNLRSYLPADKTQLELLKKTFVGLKDVCDVINCQENNLSLVDYILFRQMPQDAITLTPTGWALPDDFTQISDNGQSKALSDHSALFVTFKLSL